MLLGLLHKRFKNTGIVLETRHLAKVHNLLACCLCFNTHLCRKGEVTNTAVKKTHNLLLVFYAIQLLQLLRYTHTVVYNQKEQV